MEVCDSILLLPALPLFHFFLSFYLFIYFCFKDLCSFKMREGFSGATTVSVRQPENALRSVSVYHLLSTVCLGPSLFL